MSSVRYEAVEKRFGAFTALRSLTLDVPDHAFLALLGPSGCGKTTALRILAGLEPPTGGRVLIGERNVTRLQPRDRDVAMVFQSYALYPHMTVAKNMGFALRRAGMPKAQVRAKVQEAAQLLGIVEQLERKPNQLSGGQRQRVAMGRAIVRNPQVFLMDEPLSNLDAKLRVQMRAEISRIQHEFGATTIYVTHDQIEAMTMGDRVAVLRKGELQQVSSPQTLYEQPANLFVASFIGSPEMNLIEARLERTEAGLVCLIGTQTLVVPDELVRARPEIQAYAGRRLGLGIRPEHLDDAAHAPSTSVGRLRGRIVTTELLGFELLAHVEIEAKPVLTQEIREVVADVDRSRLTELEAEARASRTVFVGRFEASSRVLARAAVELAVDTRHLHFFDLETEEAIGVAGAAPLAAGASTP